MTGYRSIRLLRRQGIRCRAGTTAPQFVGQPAWTSKVVLPVFQRVLLGELTPAQAADELAKGLEQSIDGTLV